MFIFIKNSARVAAALSVLLSPCVAYAEGHMARGAINPATRAAPIFNQGEVVTAPTRCLTIAGQASLQTDPDAPFGVSTLHPGDMRAQMTEVLPNIDAVLEGAGMTRDDLTKLTVYVTDSGAAHGNFDVLMGWLGDARPPQSLVAISGLAIDGMDIEISARAAK